MEFEFLGFEIFDGLVVLGLITGTTFGLLAVGLLLVYRSSRLINFAHGAIGAFGAILGGHIINEWGLPYWTGFAAAVVTAAAAGALTELVVVRRLRAAPRLMSLVATLGMAQLLVLLAGTISSSTATRTNSFPIPSGLPEFNVGAFRVTSAYSAMLVFSAAIVVALETFLRRSRYGVAIRAATANPDRARLVGISASRMSLLTWIVAGGVAGVTVMFLLPTRSAISVGFLGPGLLLRALVPVVLARMRSLYVAFVAGVALGLVEQVVLFRYPSHGVIDLVLFLIVVGGLLLQSREGGRETARDLWAAVQPSRPLPDPYRDVWLIRNLGRIVGVIAVGVGLVVAQLATNATSITLLRIVVFALVGLSLGIVTGLSGQLSLGQFALAAAGAVAVHNVGSWRGSDLLGFLAAMAVGGLASLLLGLPALRVRGMMLAVITLAFGLAMPAWGLTQSWAFGSGVEVGDLTVGPLTLDTKKSYLAFSVVVLGLAYLVTANAWRGGVGLRLRALRDNEDAARAFGIPAVRTKLEAFVVSGVIAGLGGAVFAHVLSRLSGPLFEVETSLNVAALTVLGGIGMLAGPLLGALYVVGIPEFLPLDNAGLAATSLGWLLVILYFPGGLAQVIGAPRDRLFDWLARRHGLDPVAVRADDAVDDDERTPVIVSMLTDERRGSRATGTLDAGIRLDRTDTSPADEQLLSVHELVKAFGGLRAVDGVSLDVHRGETLGLIGTNGAGKTTLFELLGGFTHADSGEVRFAGQDITSWPAERRAQVGIVRSFQDAALFPTLTVLEVVSLAHERLEPTRLLASVAGLQGPEERKRGRALDLVETMGLQRYRHKQIRQLSTGTRRVVDLACVVALQPTVVLLDEPSSGIAQRETEALGELLVNLKSVLDLTMVVIEHDIPLVCGVADRMIAMDLGRIIASGSPSQVCDNPTVVASYLGTDQKAIARSDAADPVVGGIR